jgi:NAD(P)-dependent dehydrogenase (short-subunit alcohol dehydrogenase family)
MKEKVALITGGSSGIGRAAALLFAREGAKVVITARGEERGKSAVREIEAAGGTALFIPGDVSQASHVASLVEQSVAAFGRIDYEVNNSAALEEPFALTVDFTEEQFDRSIALNLKSVWLCMRQQIRQMLAQQPVGGAIVNTSSINGLGGVPRAAFKRLCWRLASIASAAGTRQSRNRSGSTTSKRCRWGASAVPRRRPKRHCGCVRTGRLMSPDIL